MSVCGVALLVMGGCTSTSEQGSGSSGITSGLSSFFSGFANSPPPAPKPAGLVEAQECPPVTVIPGRASIRNGEGAGLRSQIAIANVARECLERPDGTVVVKVGVEGRALLGPAGGNAGRFDVPVSFQLVKLDRVITTRNTRTSVSIPPGQDGTSFVVVQGDLIVPPNTGEFDIEVGFGTASTARIEQIARERRSLIDRPPPTPKKR